jgi:lipid A 3-O-deacylase
VKMRLSGDLNMKRLALLVAFATSAMATPAVAGEVFVGIAAHEVNTPFTLKTQESGVDFQIGYRGEKIGALHALGSPQPYAFASINSAGDTSFAAAGLSWTIGKKAFYVRPAIGVAIHTGTIPRLDATRRQRLDLGSRVLFEPEIGIGYRLSEKVSFEANWSHVSHAQLFGAQNPGLDMIGLRVGIRI